MTKRCVVAVLLGCLCLALAACGEEEPDTPVAVKATVTAPSPEPTQAVTPTPTVEPTALPATPETAPTAVPSPSPAPTEVPSPTPLPTTTPGPQPTSVVTPTPAATPVPSEVTALNFTGVRVLLSEPSQVQATFSLRDQDGSPVILPGSDVQRATRIFERGDGEEEWEELDYTETNFFVHSAERFALEVVFILDFTRSMTTWQLPDGTAGSTLMRHALERALDRLAEAHRVGVVAFHDRNAEPVILAFPTTDRDFIRTEVAQFAESGFDSGSSRLWDAVARGLDLFSVEEGLPVDVTRALVFLSDGRDTSSVQTRDDVVQLAQERGVQLYPLGLGEVYQESDLRTLATATNGAYYAVAELAELEAQFTALVNDFAGQYKLSYTTLRRSGAYAVRIETTLGDVTGVFTSAALPFGEIYSPDTQGRIAVDPPTVDLEEQTATTFVRALHVPRNIQHFRFTLPIDLPTTVSLVSADEGGLLDGWELSEPDSVGYWSATGPAPLPFGNFGLLFKVVVSDVTAEDIAIPIVFDNSGYTGNKQFLVVSGAAEEKLAQIAFASLRDENWEIYVMNADGSGQKRLTDDPANDVAPHWSPDARRIAFASNRAGNFDIYVMNADGSEVAQLTDDPGDDFAPRWSPDGRKLAFYSERENNVDVYVMNADGSGQTRLTFDRGRELAPTWSPDGVKIAYTSDRERNFDIYVMNADGSGHTKLTSDRAADTAPAWSPDGHKLVFTSKRDGNWEIYIINADGTGLTRLTTHPADDFAPAWSADGNTLAFYSIRNLNYEIYVMNVANGNVTRLTDHPALDADPAWSP
ncbi:MAG: VWA domain-containing protein [Chloroflexi bacterium]|nr:VWA domain-containing protein [Chloroflexota bacterium]